MLCSDARRGQDQGECREVREAGLVVGPGDRRPRAERGLRPGGTEHSEGGRTAAAGRERLRHPAARHAGPDPRCRGASGGAAEMSIRPYKPKPTTVSRSEEHTSELQSLMRTSYAGF